MHINIYIYILHMWNVQSNPSMHARTQTDSCSPTQSSTGKVKGVNRLVIHSNLGWCVCVCVCVCVCGWIILQVLSRRKDKDLPPACSPLGLQICQQEWGWPQQPASRSVFNGWNLLHAARDRKPHVAQGGLQGFILFKSAHRKPP